MKFPTKIPFTYRNIRLRIKAAITKQELIWYVWFNRYDGSDPEFILGLPCDDFIDNGMIRNGAELGSSDVRSIRLIRSSNRRSIARFD